ncbi:MAG: branched-chain amino acid ABC transporter substrate-binding protein [Chloroflexota bacterium]
MVKRNFRDTRRGFVGKGAAIGAALGAAALPRAAFAAPATQMAESVKIVSALPMTGSSYGQTSTVVNGIRMAIEEASRMAGSFFVEFEAWDDATAAAGEWDAAKVAELANRAASDPNIMVYIGHFNSGAAKISIPVLNSVGLVMISPANTYPGLTKPGKGERGEPDIYYPSGFRNYTRVIPADDLQGAVGAAWAKTLNASTAYIIDDTELYGKGIADVFANTCPKIGIRVVGRDGIDGRAADYRAVATKIRAANPDVIYYGGITQNNAGTLLKDIRGAGVNKHFIGPDGIKEKAFLDDAGEDAEGVWSTFGGVPPSAYQGELADWKKRYHDFAGGEPEPYAIYGYEAAKVALDAIARAGVRDRNVVRDAVFATQNFTGLLGTWSFDANGDTSNTTMSVSRASRIGGKLDWVLQEILTAPA